MIRPKKEISLSVYLVHQKTSAEVYQVEEMQ